MSKFLARSPLADLLARICTALLFLLLLPVIFLVSLLPGIDRPHPRRSTATARKLRGKPT